MNSAPKAKKSLSNQPKQDAELPIAIGPYPNMAVFRKFNQKPDPEQNPLNIVPIPQTAQVSQQAVLSDRDHNLEEQLQKRQRQPKPDHSAYAYNGLLNHYRMACANNQRLIFELEKYKQITSSQHSDLAYFNAELAHLNQHNLNHQETIRRLMLENIALKSYISNNVEMKYNEGQQLAKPRNQLPTLPSFKSLVDGLPNQESSSQQPRQTQVARSGKILKK